MPRPFSSRNCTTLTAEVPISTPITLFTSLENNEESENAITISIPRSEAELYYRVYHYDKRVFCGHYRPCVAAEADRARGPLFTYRNTAIFGRRGTTALSRPACDRAGVGAKIPRQQPLRGAGRRIYGRNFACRGQRRARRAFIDTGPHARRAIARART